ncbi:MAG: AlpA family phage regulatory protein [Arenicellales bacterium]|jgi:predicted DNA-binding transcriptional regulator AlpA|nr:AlpA family phage regulatory protein [Arenicellales bacterium]MDP7119945.1 AlpA family phage regulatory protein [Arenicellales bacterium]MDP7192975.1 AlpA family phage regulatory protein [Arenicellales bacterium]MDP7490756.1 AlpA family phage regulatory protein [Arenicellales bacterium]MDP7562984.1 AlpA family phage regulatory protein [Arenicellales bacterium]|tara:strand:- start:217 stop:429 length:213 start_codon:yes stop_codon:yes gene_type:complete
MSIDEKPERLLRISQIIGDKKADIEPLIPVSRSHWWTGVSDGRYPKPIKLSRGVTVWRESDIRALIEQAG